ncbi:MAG: tetratricopeptide repeat protein [Chthoniobacterales bacterium]
MSLQAAEQPAANDKLADAKQQAWRSLQDGRPDAALKALEGVPQDEPTGFAPTYRGLAYFQQGKLDEAAQALREAHAAFPGLYVPQLYLGDTLFRQKKWAEARTVYQETLKQTNVLILNERLRYGILLTYLGAKDDAGAKAALDRIVFPTESPAYYYAQAAWGFAHDNRSAGEKWIATAARVFDQDKTAWFAHFLFDLGWIKTQPPPTVD